MLLHPVNTPSAGVLVPLICMPGPAEDGPGMFERLKTLAQTNLAFPALLVGLDLSEPGAIEAWPAVFAEAAKQYRVADHGLVFGHGPGARHAQYFTLANPEQVLACAVLSADAWAEPADAHDSEAQRRVSWLVGCGVHESPGLRYGAEQFQVGLAEMGCRVDFLDWDSGPAQPGLAEQPASPPSPPDHAIENALQFFNEALAQKRAAA